MKRAVFLGLIIATAAAANDRVAYMQVTPSSVPTDNYPPLAIAAVNTENGAELKRQTFDQSASPGSAIIVTAPDSRRLYVASYGRLWTLDAQLLSAINNVPLPFGPTRMYAVGPDTILIHDHERIARIDAQTGTMLLEANLQATARFVSNRDASTLYGRIAGSKEEFIVMDTSDLSQEVIEVTPRGFISQQAVAPDQQHLIFIDVVFGGEPRRLRKIDPATGADLWMEGGEPGLPLPAGFINALSPDHQRNRVIMHHYSLSENTSTLYAIDPDSGNLERLWQHTPALTGADFFPMQIDENQLVMSAFSGSCLPVPGGPCFFVGPYVTGDLSTEEFQVRFAPQGETYAATSQRFIGDAINQNHAVPALNRIGMFTLVALFGLAAGFSIRASAKRRLSG